MFTRKSVALFVLAALAAGVAVDVLRDEGTGSPERRALPAAPATRNTDARQDLVWRLKRERVAGEVTGDPFAGREAVRPAAGAPLVPAGPPPFPYRYAGQFRMDDSDWRVYLLKGSDLVQIKVGDVLENSFRVTAIGADEFEVVHLPSAATQVMTYASLGTGSTVAQGESAPQSRIGATSAIAAASSAARHVPDAGSLAGTGSQGAGVIGIGALAGTSRASAISAAGGSSAAVTAGPVPTGQLGSAGPSTGAARLGIAPAASNSMPMSPAPTGIMQTLPAPTGRLGI